MMAMATATSVPKMKYRVLSITVFQVARSALSRLLKKKVKFL